MRSPPCNVRDGGDLQTLHCSPKQVNMHQAHACMYAFLQYISHLSSWYRQECSISGNCSDDPSTWPIAPWAFSSMSYAPVTAMNLGQAWRRTIHNFMHWSCKDVEKKDKQGRWSWQLWVNMFNNQYVASSTAQGGGGSFKHRKRFNDRPESSWKLTDWLTDRPTNQLTKCPTDWLTNYRLYNRLTSTSWLTKWLTNWLAHSLTDRPTKWLTDQLTAYLTKCPKWRLVSQLTISLYALTCHKL